MPELLEFDSLGELPIRPIYSPRCSSRTSFQLANMPPRCPYCGCRCYWRSEDGEPMCMQCARDPRVAASAA